MRIIENDDFNCSISERATFEAGIKLASLYHQFIGVPVAPESREGLEKAMTEAMRMQPHVVDAGVRIDTTYLEKGLTGVGYCSLSEKMLRAWVIVDVEGTICQARLEWKEEMGYPLMWVEKVEHNER